MPGENVIKLSEYRHDGFKNAITGHGTTRDNIEQFTYGFDKKLDKETIEALYAQHEIVWKIIDLFPDDSLRNWIDIKHDAEPEINKSWKKWQFRQKLNEALRLARLHGGAALFLDIDDGRDVDEPVDMSRINGIRDAEVIEKYYLYPVELRRSMRSEYYRLYDWDGQKTVQYVHKDRLVILQGARVSSDWFVRNWGWSASYVDRAYRPIVAYTIAHNYVPTILKDFIRDVVKLQGLNDLAINDNDGDLNAFKSRLDAMFLAQSLINKLVIDTEDDYTRQSTSLSGINDLIRNPERRLIAATGIPHTKLLGESPGASLSQSGDSQEKDWHKAVSAYQEDQIRSPIDKVIMYTAAGMNIDDDIEFCFNPLDIPSQKEQAETFKIVMEGAAKGVDSGIITTDEAAAMFEGGMIKTCPNVDMEDREMMNGVPTNGYEETEVENPDRQEINTKETIPPESQSEGARVRE